MYVKIHSSEKRNIKKMLYEQNISDVLARKECNQK